jgi:hypothetical protein
MEEPTKAYIQNIEKAIKELKIADHIIYTTYPIIKDKRLLLKALEQIYNSTILTVNAMLQYDFLWKRITLSKDSISNFNTFLEKSSHSYQLSEAEISGIKELVSIAENHKKSAMEFQRKDKVIMLSPSSRTTIIDVNTLKRYLNLTKMIIEKAKISMSLE